MKTLNIVCECILRRYNRTVSFFAIVTITFDTPVAYNVHQFLNKIKHYFDALPGVPQIGPEIHSSQSPLFTIYFEITWG